MLKMKRYQYGILVCFIVAPIVLAILLVFYIGIMIYPIVSPVF